MVTRTRLNVTFIPTFPVFFYVPEPLAVERTTSSLHNVSRRHPFRSVQLSPVLEKIGGAGPVAGDECPPLVFVPYSTSRSQSSDLVTRKHPGCYLCCICNVTAPSCGFTAIALFLGSNTFSVIPLASCVVSSLSKPVRTHADGCTMGPITSAAMSTASDSVQFRYQRLVMLYSI
jgi:hypothetical protein